VNSFKGKSYARWRVLHKVLAYLDLARGLFLCPCSQGAAKPPTRGPVVGPERRNRQILNLAGFKLHTIGPFQGQTEVSDGTFDLIKITRCGMVRILGELYIPGYK
jgi:hypothetical protein